MTDVISHWAGKMRSLGISLVSLSLTAAVVGNAYFQKKQFYPSVVYITKSNPSMAVIYIQSLILVLMLGKLMRKIFLGTLRAAEFEHLMERFWYALTETCLAFTVFRDDFNPKFVALFTVLLFLKSFHWLAEDRVDYMERSPVIGWLFHIRVAGLLGFLGLLDYMLIAYAYQSTIAKGATVQLVFGFEYAILITMVANTTIKYVLHAAELRSENPWENKAVFLLYTELIIGLIRVILYIIFVFLMVKIYTLPLFAFRPMYYTLRNFKKALNDVILSRRAIRNMYLYPDATAEELSTGDNICIICREDMVTNSKKLPCGHIFHTACLRSWFQRQQTCPTCRLNILRTPTPATPNQPVAAVQPVAPQQPQVNNPFANFLNGPNPFNFAMPPPINVQPTNAAGTTAVPLTPGAPFMMPSFPYAPYALPPPPIPANLDTLTDDEVRALEGNERKHVEERIKLLRNIQTLLDASVSLMNQYSMITARLPPPPPPAPTTDTSAATIPTTTTATDDVIQPTAPILVEETPKTDNTKIVNTEQGDLVKIEDVGREDHLDSVKATVSTNTISSITTDDTEPSTSSNTTLQSPAAVANDENAELRRRRLQKFLQTEAKNTD